jgi:hypothetical protein
MPTRPYPPWPLFNCSVVAAFGCSLTRYGRLMFDICGAPFGKDFFFSWWLVKPIPGFMALVGCAVLIASPLFIFAIVAGMLVFKGFIYMLILAFIAIGMGMAFVRKTDVNTWNTIEDAILVMPLVGLLYKKFVKPVTYYSEDTRLMFEDTVHRIVLQVVSGVLTLNKLPELSPEKMKPQSRKALA